MKKISAILLLFVVVLGTAQDKSVPFDKKLFKDRKEGFKEASKNLKEANERFELATLGKFDEYKEAIPFFEKANAFNPDNADLNFKLGECYLMSIYKSKAQPFFIRAYELNPTISKLIHKKIGIGYQLQYNFEKALYEFGLYRKTLNNNTDAAEIVELNQLMEQCKSGQSLMDHPERVWIDNLGELINSKYAEYAPVISADESLIMFTGKRIDGVDDAIDPETGKFFEDIFIAEKDKNGKWGKATNIGRNINTKSHEATAGLSNDGLTMFIYFGSRGMGDIYMATKEEDGWSKPKDLGKNINNKKAHETSACMSFDKKWLYFISNREGGKGNHDIWKSPWDEEKEQWGEAVNLGDVINTDGDEIGVVFHPDGRTLYFQSSGHPGMGGYDIFYATMNDDGSWNEPKNIGYPISTPDHDVHFSISASGKHAYYSSFREEDGFGEKDIYMITFLGKEKEPLMSSEDNLLASIAAPIKEKLIQPKVEVQAKNLAILKGLVLDAETKKPVKSLLDLVDNGTQTQISQFNNDAQTGKFLMSLPAGKNYGIAAKAEGYLFHSENFDIPADAGFREYEKIIYLNKIKKGVSIVLRNIFFDTDKYSLKPESKTELDRLIKLLEDNPDLKIEISGHTDTHGSASYNQKLSEDRAGAVVDYLVVAGFARERFEYKGYGEAKPMISDTDRDKMVSSEMKDEADAKNRRTEFMIID